MIVAACVLLLVALNVFTSNAQCPANTFTCKDGSCIPQDWVGDGESDCDDASDEAVGIVMHLTAPESSTNGTLKSSSRIQIEETADDPFDNFAAKSHFSVTPPREVKPTLKLDAEVASQKCANDVQHRIDQCSADLINWARTIDEIDFSKISLLIDKNSWSQVNQGCDLITEYRTCTEGLQIINCIIPETIRVWNDADLYACQLLLPSIREHEKCFAIARDSRCDSTSGGAKVGSSPICRLISSVSADLRCVERLSVGVCDESALEVINPIQSETTHIFQQLTCAQRIV
uniref:Very low-density lipoprotein receptor n=1 Tax=Ascaris lumbricoides TaxID=6252 RepID=A0A0M3I3K1_ASCLU